MAKEQIKGFNEAYKKVKKMGFEDYFCFNQTTWKEAYEKFKKGMLLQEDTSILKLQENVNITLKAVRLPYCKKCGQLFSFQEFKVGYKECEHCEGKAKIAGKSIKLKCLNKKCLYEWNYKGSNPFYACCPRCKSSVNIRKNTKRGRTNGNKRER